MSVETKTLETVLTALGLNLGAGFILGFAVGYALKKIAKLVLIVGGLIVLILVYLHYKGIIVVNYAILQQVTEEILRKLRMEVSGLLSFINTSIPFAGGFTVGFILGLKKG